MIEALKPYPGYKDSGVAWLGEVPEHWDVLPARALFAEVKERDHPDEEMLSVTITNGVIRQEALLEGSSKKDSSNVDRSAYKLVCPGDIAYNKMRAWQGAIGVSGLRGIISPAYVVMRLRQDNDPRYFHYLFRTPQFAKEAERWSYGITSDMWSLRPEHFRMIYSVLPSRAEQSAIGRFLDYLDGRVRRYAHAKQRLIKLLEEHKQIIIQRAVTGGLAPGVPLKHSRLEWLEQVPSHWEISTVKRLARSGSKTFTDGDWIELPYITDHGVRLIQTGNVGSGEYREKGFRYVSEETFEALNCTEVCAKDVLICRLDGPVGRACLAPNLGVKAITSVDNTILKVSADVDPRYVVYVMSSPGWLGWIQSICRAGGGFRYRISRSMLGDARIPKPPLAEQEKIADYLDGSLCSIREAVVNARTAIGTLREYHRRVVADVVTGKLDVREAAAKLPQELVEPPLEDDRAVLGGEEVSEVEEGETSLEESNI